jgi:competence protein ComEA
MRRNFLDDYFGFTRQQRNGVAVLAVLCTLLLVARIVIPRVMPPSSLEIRNLPLIPEDSGTRKTPAVRRFVQFDPNTVSRETLRSMGLDARSASAFVNYRSKGFHFRKNEDLLKVFGVRRSWYDSVAPYVNIQGAALSGSKQHALLKSATLRQVALVELNEADTTLLETLPAIGPSFARRIVKYRELLGGYHNTSQLLEVYGFDEGRFDAIRTRVIADSAKIAKLKINTDDFKAVNRHPYISYELTKKIFNARRKSKLTASSLRELFGDDKLFEKVRPYIDYE